MSDEIMVCKFDDKVQCVNYACEEDISDLEVTKEECALHARIKIANKILEKSLRIIIEQKMIETAGDNAVFSIHLSKPDLLKLRAALSLANQRMQEPTK